MAKRGGNAPSRVATPDELETFGPAERTKGYRLITFPCHKCGGSGIYSHYHGQCFSCNGRGVVEGRLYTPEHRAKLDEQKERRHERKQEKAEQARRDGYAECVKRHPEAYAAMAEVMDDVLANGRAAATEKWGDFIVDVSTKGYDAPVTERQAESVVRAIEGKKKFLEKVEQDQAQATPVIEGEQRLVGEVLTVKWQSSMYGDTLKMLVKDDRGFKVWGTVPKSIRTSHELEKGDRVALTATVEASDDDPTFGFFKNPKRDAEVLTDAK